MTTGLSQPRKFNGLALLVAVFREFDPKTRATMIEKLGKSSPILARLVERCDFIYADLSRLDTRSTERLIACFSEDDWAIAWKLTSETLRTHLLSSMPDRKKIAFQKAVKDAPKVPRIQVIKLQFRIATKARQMLMEGKLAMHARKRIIRRKK
jgi:flagellar motor switch protein FliG